MPGGYTGASCSSAKLWWGERDGKMKIRIAHVRNAILGWDINVCVDSDDGQKIAKVEIRVNDSPVVQDYPNEPPDSWEQQVKQKGIYPGDNKVEVTVNDQNGNESRAEQKW
jgi:hypothetical protein